VALPASWRRARQFFRHFRIDAPRMAVRSHLPWPWRVMVVAVLIAIVGGMWWWGFDFGQIFGGFNRKEIGAKVSALEADNAKMHAESTALRARNSQLESELAMTAGAQATLSKQTLELMGENSQLKEELSFLQKLVSDSNKQVGLAIQRLTVERERDDAWHYSVLVVRGGTPRDEFEGALALQATVQPAPTGGVAARPTVVSLPEEQPGSAPALKLKFKYYQRLEGTITVPPGAQVRSVTARAFEAGQANARATRTLVIP
jgi:cell division protein FtsB